MGVACQLQGFQELSTLASFGSHERLTQLPRHFDF